MLRKIHKTNQTGFTTIEVLIAMFVITILISISLGIVVLSDQITTRTKAYSQANEQAFAKIQEYELSDFSDIPNGTGDNDFEIEDFSDEFAADTSFDYRAASAKVYSRPNSGSLKKVWVEINYSHGNESRIIEYATYIQLGGVGR